jgi:hypothetical protein
VSGRRFEVKDVRTLFESLPIRAGCVLAVWVGLACHSPVSDPNSTVPGKCSATAPLIGAQKTDILFVVDNSESMSDKQVEVARELPAFVDILQKGAGVTQDFQMGLITTSIYQNALYNGALYYQRYPTQSGKLQPVPDVLADGGVVLGTGTERILNGGDPNLVDKFGRLVRVGINGSGQETPFEAIRQATTTWANVPLDAGWNGGFFRDGAQLLIITVMDEDDCSEFADVQDAGWRPGVFVGIDKNRAPNFTDYCTNADSQIPPKLTPVKTYHDLFVGLKDSTGDQRTIIWADIAPVAIETDAGTCAAGPPFPNPNCRVAQAFPDLDGGTLRNVNCPNSFGAGFRHRNMAALFDETLEGDLDSICNPSFHDTLVNIAGEAVARQTIQVYNVPDPALLVVQITRANGTVMSCTTTGGGITYEQTPQGQELVHFAAGCRRHIDDTAVTVQLLCAG